MFYEDDHDVMVAQFGTGDISIMPGIIDSSEVLHGTISLADGCGICHPIGRKPPEDEWRKVLEIIHDDTDLNTVIRLVFTKSESIDILIECLQEAKDFMTGVRPHPTRLP